jgi:hypothetical protein
VSVLSGWEEGSFLAVFFRSSLFLGLGVVLKC